MRGHPARMSISYATMLENAKTALNRLLAGQAVVEWNEGGHKIKVTSPSEMLAIIRELEQLASQEATGSNPFSVITSDDL